uniref:Uncharacterized protein n=1 Tax=Meloidogyne enterolobii TaxID=390850 RepID=A0A6V7WKF7_MELEN|nr:unnamed protein product [Meloidogyne enterolobii]
MKIIKPPSFSDRVFKYYIFNPEMIELLFKNEENIPLQFRSNRCLLTYCNHNINNVLKFNLEHLIINDILRINFASFGKKQKCINNLIKLLLNGGRTIKSIWIRIRDKLPLSDLIIEHIETSKNCSNIISLIEVDLIPYNIKKKQMAYETDNTTTLTVTNIYNPKIIFKIEANNIDVKIEKILPYLFY